MQFVKAVHSLLISFSPIGHTAKNQSYTILDYNTGFLVAFSVLDKRESSLMSTRMELFGLIRCLYELLADGVDVAKICTDQHVMVCKFFSKWHLGTTITDTLQYCKFCYSGLIAEEAGLQEPPKTRKRTDTVVSTLQQAVHSRDLQLTDKIITAFHKIEQRYAP